MSTNFLQHNPTAANQEIDAQYVAENLRTAGIGVDAILPSDWLNKLFYQTTTFVAAFAQMMSNKGYTMNDADINALTTQLTNIVTNNDLKASQITVPFSPNPTFDASKANGFRIDLSGNVTSSSLINHSVGQIITFYIVSVLPGTFSFVWPNNVSNPPNVQTESSGNLLTMQFISDGIDVYPLSTMINTLLSDITVLSNQIIALQSGKQNNLGFTPVQQGTGIGQFQNTVKLGWDNATRLKATVDGLDLGNVVFDTQLVPVGNAVTALQGTVSGLQSQVTVLNNEVNPLIPQVSSLNSQVGLLNTFKSLFLANPVTNGTLEIPTNAGTMWLQWGQGGNPAGGNSMLNFPIQFPTACLIAVPISIFGGVSRILELVSFDRTSITVHNNGNSGGWTYIAIGH